MPGQSENPSRGIIENLQSKETPTAQFGRDKSERRFHDPQSLDFGFSAMAGFHSSDFDGFLMRDAVLM